MKFVIYGKNVQSTQTEARLHELLAELETIGHWDAILLNETWRANKEEHFETYDGHLFMASGGSKGQKGVGILVHRRWKKAVWKFQPVNNRVCSVNIDTGVQKLALIAVYMPHGGCNDNEVEQTYTLLSKTVKMGRKNGLVPVICGDWNAVVGSRMEADDFNIIGDYGTGLRNSRGS